MATSQNCRFTAALENAEHHPVGEQLVACISEELRVGGWTASEPELWRDSGWMITVSRDGSELEASFALINEGQALLQVAPRYEPGLIGRWLNKKASADANTVLAVSILVSEFLRQRGFGDQRWGWDGYPADDSPSRPVP